MSKLKLDYSNTIIYKISCKDPNITDTYIGHTTNFQQRLLAHKTVCNKLTTNNLKVYKFIREHGGWENWEMVEIARYNCKGRDEARLKEHEHLLSSNSTLNTNLPVCFGNQTKKFGCTSCNYETSCKSSFDKHLMSNEHKMKENESTIQTQKYMCSVCDYSTSRKSSYDKHLLTYKHSLKKNGSSKEKNKNFICRCQKVLNSRTTMWRHRKSCFTDNVQHYAKNTEADKKTNTITPDLVLSIIQQNQEFKDMILEQQKIIIEIAKK